jgi:dolichol-phosphate mannosyltransferase
MTPANQFAALVAVIIPTYNERDNITSITARVRSTMPAADALIVDDNSPDLTGRIADELAAADSHIHVLHRQAKAGLGAAYIAGFRWALRRRRGDGCGRVAPARAAALALGRAERR